MIEVNGEYNKAIIYSNSYDEGAYNQLLDICNYKHFEGANIKVMPDYHAGKGCVIGFTSVETPVLIPNLIGVDIGCLDGETEVLTENGWIKIKDFDIQNPQQILIYDKETDFAVFDYPLEYIKQPCDKFYHLKTNGGLDQAVCENHRILAWLGDKSRGYELRDYIAKDFVTHHNSLKKGIYGGIKTTFNLQQNGINNFPDIYLRLNIMISADGTLRTNIDGTQRVELHFKKQRKIDRALYLLTQAGIPYSVTESSNESTYIYFKNKTPQKFKFSKDLRFVFKLSQEQLKVVIDECRYWDRTLNKRGQVQYSTSVKENADAIQYAFAVCGVRAGINVNKYPYRGWQDTYNVYETYNEIVRFPERKINEIPSLDGFKYCFRTATGYFVIRRNNRISITGNCGVLAVKLSNPIDVKELDNFIRRDIPSGFDVNEEIQPFYWFVPLEKLNCFKHLNKVERLKKSLGSLGGGNHFIELDVDKEGNQWLVIHSGSRNLGKQVANYYQELAKSYDFSKELDDLIKKTPEKEREEKIKEFKERFYVLKGLEFLRGEDYFHYLNDMKICQEFAHYNRYQIATAILVRFGMTLGGCEKIESVHNYYDFTDGVIRKGAISARNGEKCIIPMNMRDGSLICIGKGNPDWNYSAPHGAGRLMSRAEARETLKMDEFKESMQGIYSSCIKESTLDEAPMAYKPMEEIVGQIGDTVEIIDIIKPIYNFKA